MSGKREVLEVDVLIVGGGIQGLTLLDRLVAAGVERTLLMTRDALGVGESLHSHGYTHLGYTLPGASTTLARELAECGAWWWRRLERAGSPYLGQPPTYYCVSSDEAPERLRVWNELGLAHEALAGAPEALRGGAASGPGVRHFRIHDRTLSMRELLADLAAPLQDRIARGELVRIDLDEAGKRVTACHFSLGNPLETLLVRPRVLLLATGRFTQPLLRRARTPRGECPLAERHRELNSIRYVPMLLVRGRNLPHLTAILQSHALSIATHSVDGEEAMWIVTYMRDHVSDRGDFDESRESGPGQGLATSLGLLETLIPSVRERISGDLRFSFYFGGKIDHPAGGNGRYIGDCGLENARVLWPGLWSLALANAQDVVAELEALAVRTPAAAEPPGAPLRAPAPPRGVPVGEERRLKAAQPWWSRAQLVTRLGLV